ncbi:MAG: hypothetical protein RIE08_06050 [Acidimicrobiales bacterium]
MTDAASRDDQFFKFLPGPSARETEEQVAGYIELTLEHVDGRLLGPRTRCDAATPDALRVDFTYESTDQPVALEVTSLTLPAAAAFAAELRKFGSALDEKARRNAFEGWHIGIRQGSDLAALGRPLEDFLRSQSSRDAPALFSTREAPTDLDATSLSLLSDALDLGLELALRFDQPGITVEPPISQTGTVGGFHVPLRAALNENAEKLREARPRETHLVVWPGRSVSADPSQTPPPRLPDSVDVLWVMLDYYDAKCTYRLWRTAQSDSRWELLHHPLGEPRQFHPARED